MAPKPKKPLCRPLSTKDPPPDMDRGSPGGEDGHFRQKLLYKSCPKCWHWHLDTIFRCLDAPYPPRIHHQRCRKGVVLMGKRVLLTALDCFFFVDFNSLYQPITDYSRAWHCIGGSETFCHSHALLDVVSKLVAHKIIISLCVFLLFGSG